MITSTREKYERRKKEETTITHNINMKREKRERNKTQKTKITRIKTE